MSSFLLHLKILLIGAFFFCLPLSANEVSNSLNIAAEKVIEVFLRTLMTSSELGYVLYGDKPVFFTGYPEHEKGICRNFPEEDAYLVLGGRVWQEAVNSKEGSNFTLHFKKFLRGDEPYVEVLGINHSAFLKVVSENLPLFQYVLGPEVNPEMLLERFKDPDENLYHLLNHDKVLVGIVLGFGTQNALWGSRYEQLQESIAFVPSPPFKLQTPHAVIEYMRGWGMPLEANPHNLSLLMNRSIKVGFGYTSLDEEYANLAKSFVTAPSVLEEYHPYLIFANLKNPENERLVASYISTQKEIQKILVSKTFLEDVLGRLSATLNSERIKFNLEEMPKKTSSVVFALHLWNYMKGEEITAVDAFVEGFKIAQNGNPNPKAYDKPYSFIFSNIPKYQEKKRQFEKTEALFNSFEKDSSMFAVVPNKVYCRVLNDGTGDGLDELHPDVILNYSIKMGNGQVLAHSIFPNFVNLHETIPGFALGVQGMKVGERRELFIHPQYAYGFYSLIDTMDYLQVDVELLEIGKPHNAPEKFALPNLETDDFLLFVNRVGEAQTEADEKRIKEEYAFSQGYRIGADYSYCSDIVDMGEVATILKALAKGEVIHFPQNSNFERNMEELNWLTYARKREEQERIASDYFLHLWAFPKMRCLEEGLLYYPLLSGDKQGKILDESDEPLVHYCLRDHFGNILEDTYKEVEPKKISLQHAIEGFKKGLVGMREGEKGILFIHPNLGYSYAYQGSLADTFLIAEVEIIASSDSEI